MEASTKAWTVNLPIEGFQIVFKIDSGVDTSKLQLVLAPFSSFFPPPLDDSFPEKTTLLSHSFRQLDRIDSLSEQIGFLEERLGTCEQPSTWRWIPCCSQKKEGKKINK
uniref:Uncharacterized protein n=1 Tax=Xiphophorus couchianus TaxID=32473 RepID=A0A3B5M1K0_9TELE